MRACLVIVSPTWRLQVAREFASRLRLAPQRYCFQRVTAGGCHDVHNAFAGSVARHHRTVPLGIVVQQGSSASGTNTDAAALLQDFWSTPYAILVDRRQ